MKIAVDARLLERKMTGIGRLLAGFLDNILKLDKDNEYFLFSQGELKEYQNKGFNIIATGKNKLTTASFYSPFWLNLVLPAWLSKLKIDIFFSPTGFLPLAGEKKYKSLIIICDVFQKVDKNFHSFFYRKYTDLFLEPSVKNSNAILTISHHSKKDILKFYKVPQEKVKVVHLAAEEKFKPRELSPQEKMELRKKYHLPEKFILYVGVLEERKNIDGLIKIADLLKEETEIPILLFGKMGYRGQKYLKEIKKRENIQYKGFIKNEDLPLLYNLAAIFIFPSFYEGFGLPVLEAMQSGLPVVSSNTSSLPEIVSQSGIMHSPSDYKGFAESIAKLLQDKNFYDKIRRQEIEQAKQFNWGKTTAEIIEAFKSL